MAYYWTISANFTIPFSHAAGHKIISIMKTTGLCDTFRLKIGPYAKVINQLESMGFESFTIFSASTSLNFNVCAKQASNI